MTHNHTGWNYATAYAAELSGPIWTRLPKARFRINSTISKYARLLSAIITNNLSPGPANTLLEQKLKAYFNRSHAVSVNQARVGLYLAFRATLSPKRKKVVMSPYTIYDVINMVVAAGGDPVFADIEATSCNLDPANVERLIDDQTGAVLLTHFHGLAGDGERLKAICKARGVLLVEDCAQAFGVKKNGRLVGSFGDISVFSFGLFKTVNSFFGGAVLTDDSSIAEKIRSEQADFSPVAQGRLLKRVIQSLTFDAVSLPIIFKMLTFWVFRHGVLSGNEQLIKLTRAENDATLREELPECYRQRMSDVQAQFVIEALDELDDETRQRTEIAELYYQALRGRNDIRVPPGSPLDGNGCLSYPIHVEDRSNVLKELMRIGRDIAPQHVHNCADLPCFSRWYRDCPNARAASERVILLPTYPRYGRREAERNIAALNVIFGGR